MLAAGRASLTLRMRPRLSRTGRKIHDLTRYELSCHCSTNVGCLLYVDANGTERPFQNAPRANADDREMHLWVLSGNALTHARSA